MNRRGRDERGQATVEFALVVPAVFVLLLLVVQTGLVARDQLLVVQAAREAARAAAISGSLGEGPEAGRLATGLDATRLDVRVAEEGGFVRATASYRSPIVVPVLRRARDSVVVTATVRMPFESDDQP